MTEEKAKVILGTPGPVDPVGHGRIMQAKGYLEAIEKAKGFIKAVRKYLDERNSVAIDFSRDMRNRRKIEEEMTKWEETK